MAEITDNPNADAIKDLEAELKTAYKEERFADLRDIAKKIQNLEPDNHLAERLPEKAEKAEAKAEAKKKKEKVEEYTGMMKKMAKEDNWDKVKALATELKTFDPESEKAAQKWTEKAEEAKKEAARKANADQINDLQDQIKAAFKEERFDEVRLLAGKLKELDPDNKVATKMLDKIEEAKKEAERKAHEKQIEELETKIKSAFEESRFEEAKVLSSQLKELDPENKSAEKWVGRIEAGKKEAEEKAQKEKMKRMTDILDALVKEEKWEEVQKKANEILALQWGQRHAIKALKKMAKAKNTEDYLTLVTVEIPESARKKPFRSGWFKKKKPIEAPIGEPMGEPIEKAEAPVPAEAPKPAQEKPVSAEAPEAKPVKGNVFTRMFGKKKESDSVKISSDKEVPKRSMIDTIVAKTEGAGKEEEEAQKVQEIAEGVRFVKWSYAFLQFSVAFIVLSAGFFYAQNIDQNNTVLGLFGVEANYASRLHSAGQELDKLKEQEKKYGSDIKRFQKGYDNQYEATINKIIEGRVNWPDILKKINEITESVYERNALSQYVKYDNFSFDAEKGTVQVSGTLSDPLGKNLTKLVELEQAFRYYPRDMNNPDDTTQPYFYDFKEFKSLSKSYDSRTGKYKSSFQLSFSIRPPESNNK